MKRVLVVGAGFLQDFVIQKAKSMGCETIAVDANPASIGFHHADKYKVINIVDEKACLAYAQKENIEAMKKAREQGKQIQMVWDKDTKTIKPVVVEEKPNA